MQQARIDPTPFIQISPLASKEVIFFLERRQSVIYSRFHSTSDSGTMMKSKVELHRFQNMRAVFFGLSSNFALAGSQKTSQTPWRNWLKSAGNADSLVPQVLRMHNGCFTNLQGIFQLLPVLNKRKHFKFLDKHENSVVI